MSLVRRSVLLFGCLALAIPAAAQVGGGSIAGVVVDQSARPIPGALITVTSTATGS